MYIGHAAIAIALKTRRPEMPILALVLAAYGPDWVDLSLMIPHAREGMAPYSHSLPAIALGAVIGALLYTAVTRRPGAGVIALAWASHWPADLVTGVKPVLGLGWMVGLDAYHIPVADFAIETMIISIACLDYARVYAAATRERVISVAMWLLLVGAQAVMDVAVAHLDPSAWSPSLLASRSWRPHVSWQQVAFRQRINPHGSCTPRLDSHGSETCRPRDRAVS